MDPHRLNTPPANGRQVRDVNGRKLDKALKAGTVQPGFAAWLAYRMQSGAVFLHHLTAQQACALTGATCADLAAERRKHRSANGNGRRVLYRRAATDNDIDAVVTKLGTEKVLAALDRITRPSLVAAE